MDRDIPVVVIGAGQAGLSTSYYLTANGVDHVVLDSCVRIGDVWRNRWDSLRLFTSGKYSGLPGMPFPGPAHGYPTKDEMAAYFEAYAAEFALPVRTDTRVEQLTYEDGAYRVATGSGLIRADHVVVATGAYHKPFVPGFAADIEADVVQLHSYEYRGPAQLAPGDVLVVGAANSGAEIAVELAGDHHVWLSGRDVGQEPTKAGTWPDRALMPVYWLIGHHLSKVTNPLGRRIRDTFLDPPRGVPRGRIGKKDIEAAGIDWVGRVSGVEDGLPMLEDGRRLDVGNVIWCTGFEADYSWIDLPVFGDYGLPRHERGVVDSQVGLYFVGLMFQTSISSALVGGVGRDAEYITSQIVQRVESSSSRGSRTGWFSKGAPPVRIRDGLGG